MYWIGFYEFCAAIGVKYEPEKLKHLGLWGSLGRSCCWWAGYDGIALCCERPIAVRLNDRRVLHCDNGPAMAFADGWQIYAINGVRVPAKVIEAPDTITLAEIRAEENAEIKRLMIERWGWPRYLQESGARVVDSRRNDIEGTDECLMATDEATVLVCACPSTARIYSLEVPQETETCRQAQSWLSSGLSDRIVSAS